MSRSLSILLLACTLCGPPLARAAVLPAAQTLFVSDKAAKHPKKMTLKVPIAVDLPGRVAACVEYGHSLEANTMGNITVKLSVVRDNFTLTKTSFKGKVKDRHFDGCVGLPVSLEEGDTVEFRFVYRKFPRLSKGDGFVVIAGLIPQ